MMKHAGLVLFLLIPFVPLETFFGKLKGIGTMTPGQWGLGIVIASGAFLIGGILFKEKHLSLKFPLPLFFAPFVIFLSTAFVHCNAFAGKPMLVDSMIQLFQAKVFAGGLLYVPLPQHYEFFMTQHMVHHADKWYSQYPPLHSLLYALGMKLSIQWLMPSTMTALTAVFVIATAKELYNIRTARLTAFLLMLSPFFIFMGSSYMNHVSTGFFLAGSLYGTIKWLKEGRVSALIIQASFLGAAMSIRPFNAVAFAAVIVPASFFSGIRNKQFLALGIGALAGIVTSGIYPVYNYLVTGDPFLTGYEILWGAAHNPGFHVSPWGTEHTLARGLLNQLIHVYTLNEYLFESIIPSLYFVGAGLFLAPLTKRHEYILPSIVFTTLLFFVFYWHRDNFLGPRYIYEATICALPLYARALRTITAWCSRRTSTAFSARSGLVTTFVACILCTVTLGFPGKFQIYNESFGLIKQDVQKAVHAQGITHGVIFMKVSWGNRIISRLHGLGIPASITQMAYLELGHCRLYRLLIDFEDEPDILLSKLKNALKSPPELILAPKLVGSIPVLDPTLSLEKGRSLHPTCKAELLYDSKGLTIFTPSLLLNEPTLDGAFVYARDHMGRNVALLEALGRNDSYLFDGDKIIKVRYKS